MKGFAGVAFDGEVGGQPVGHLAVCLGGGQGFVRQQRGAALPGAHLHVTEGQCGHGDAERTVVVNHAFQNLNGFVEMAEAHLLVAGGGAQQGMARLQGQALLQFVAGQLDLVLIVVDAGAVVVKDGRAGGVELEGAAELLQRLVVHAVAAQGDAGHHVHVPVVGGAGEQVGDAVARRLLFSAREQHVDAVEVGLGGGGIQAERLIEIAACVHDVNLAPEAVADVLELGDAQPAPAGGEFGVGGRDAGEQRLGVVQVGARAGAHHEGAEQRAGLEILFADPAGEGPTGSIGRVAGGRAREIDPHRVHAVGGRKAVERGKDFVGDFGLHGDQVQRSDADGAARAHALRGHVEQLPVQVEALFRAEKIAGKDEGDEQLLAHRERVHLRDGHVHERAGGADHEGRNARQAGGDRVGQGEAVERSHLGCAEVGERQDHKGVLRRAVDGRLTKALGQHGEKSRVPLLRLDAGGGQVGGGLAGDDAGLNLQRLHDGLESFPHFGGRGVARAGRLFETGGDHAFELRRDAGDNVAEVFGVGELDGADGLEVFGVGAGKGMAAAHQFIEDDAEGPYVRLHARLAGHELLGRHVTDGAAAGGVGGGHGRVLGQGGLRGVEVGVFRAQTAGQAKVENLDQAAVGEHHVLGLEVAVEDAQGMGRLQAVGNLYSDRQHQLQAGRSAADQPVQRLAGHVLHDDVAFVGAFAHLVDGADVGVLDGGGETGLAQDSGPHLFGREQAGAENLEHDGALQQHVVGQIDHAAAARAQLAENLVMFDGSSLHLLQVYRGCRQECLKAR